MSKRVRVIILRTAGTNCDWETKAAFEYVGAQTEIVHINELKRAKKRLWDYSILALPGGFSYGDDVSSGKILANELKCALGDEIERFICDGRLVIGICNGFQVLVKAGFLPNIYGNHQVQATLTRNTSGHFQAEWVYLQIASGSQGGKMRCIWTKGVKDEIYLPIAHGEGRFVPQDKSVLEGLRKNGQIVFRYRDNPNGSVDDIAGITDPTGRILGMMPHPERHISPYNHPRWMREGPKREGDGVAIFRNGVEYAKAHL